MSQHKWVLVTGGARRLGREFCLAFAKAGWNVFCHYQSAHDDARTTRKMVEHLGQLCETVSLDLSTPQASDSLLDIVVQRAGALPLCIVNNASIFDFDEASSSTSANLQEHFQINTVTPLLLANSLANKVLIETGTEGQYCVIHVLDQKVHNLNPDYFSYTVSKLALERSVALQAQALSPKVRVCGLSPGLLYLSGPQTQSNFDRASQVNLLNKTVNPVDVARSAVFLAENISLNGCTLRTDNGQHLVPLTRDVMFAIESGNQP